MQVYHISGAGNDFAVIDIRGKAPDLSALALRLCSITGADGLMALDTSQTADFRLHFYNADGHRGEMCGNGARCICRFANEKGIAGNTMTVQTDAGRIYATRLTGSDYRIRLNDPSVADLHRTDTAAYVELGDPGIPHAVRELPALSYGDKEVLLSEALYLRHHTAFPKGVNVNFFAMTGPDTAKVLTYERYVEDYTLACGTGCSSIAVVLQKLGRLPGSRLTCQCPGGVLTVDLTGGIYLEGPTEILNIFDHP